MNTNKEHTPLDHQRVVRVFISSTFRDMMEEREELMKFIFPELRRRCRERQVEFVEVDLRWGVTDEEKAEGKVLPICLAEIKRCRPFFIGILGEHYGWVPNEIPQELIETEGWLKEHLEHSVTELEILHGVLRNPEMEKLSFFYFRDLEVSKRVEAELLKKSDYLPEMESSHAKLISLKENIIAHEKNYPVPVRKDFLDAKTLGKLVLEDLWNVIDKKFPKEEVPSALEQERREHEAFAEARRKVYLGREEYYKRLDEHVKSEDPPLVILGESGSGKSALISNWLSRYRKDHPEEFIITHFIGGTPDSADYVRMLRRIMQEIKERYEPVDPSASPLGKERIEEDEGGIPTDPKKVVEAFPIWLAKASAKSRFILILDALNQLEDRGNAPDLGWLPEYFPPNVKVILSTLPGRSLEALKRRGLPSINIDLLTVDERKKVIPEYLKQFTKKLSTEFVDLIAGSEHTGNPLYLKALLDELRFHGEHFTLREMIEHYLQTKTVDELYEKILERYEKDYDRDRPGLVRDAMSLIWASRRGLAEAELLELLGTKESPLPRAIWSLLYLAAEESLVSRSGLLNFFHDFLRSAVEDRYLNTEELKKKEHLKLADYFEKRELDDRKVDELPCQLRQAEEWERLKDCITDIEMFPRLRTETKQYELMGYWLSIGDRFDMVVAYNTMIDNYETTSPPEEELAHRLNETAYFLYLNARYKGAEPLYCRALTITERLLGAEHPNTARSLNNLALLFDSKGDYERALSPYRRALAINEKVLGAEHPDMALGLHNLAGLFYSKGDYEGALSLLRRALAIREKVLGTDHPDTAESLNGLAVLLISKGDYEGALPLYRRALAIKEKVLGAEHPNTALSLNNLAVLLISKGDYEGVLSLLRRALAIREKVLGTDHPDTAGSLHYLALLFDRKGDYEGALPLYRRALAIKEKVLGAEHPDTALSLNGLAELLRRKGDYEGALPHYRRALAINEKVLGPEHPDIAESLNGLAELLRSKGDYEGALPLYRRALAIREKVLGAEHSDTALSLNGLALLFDRKGDYEEALPHYRRALAINEKVLGPEHPDTAGSLHNLAGLFRRKGDYEGALPLYRRALTICEKVLGVEHPNTITCRKNLEALIKFITSKS